MGTGTTQQVTAALDAESANSTSATSGDDALVWVRHPADRARLVAALVALGLLSALTFAKPDVAAGVSRDLVDLLGWLPASLRAAALGVAQLAAVAGPIGVVAALVVGARRRLAVMVVASAAVAAVIAALVQRHFDGRVPADLLDRLSVDSWLTGAAFPSPSYLAAAAAAVTVLAPGLSRTGRRGAWAMLVLFAVVRVATAVAIPLHVASMVLVGVAVGSAALLAVGGPARRQRRRDVAAALAASGVDATALASVDGRWTTQLADGSPATVLVVDRDARDAALLYRIVARLQRRGLGAERPAWSPARIAENEAMQTMLAANAGVAVPTVVAVGDADTHLATLTVRDDGRACTPDDLTDDFLAALWHQVAALHDARIAHRALHLDNVAVRDGQPVLVGFADAENAASHDLLATDVAELLVSLAQTVGVARATAAASVLGDDRLAAAVPYVQPLALSPAARHRLRAETKADRQRLLDELRSAVAETSGAPAAELAPLQRISVARIVGLAGSVVLVYVLLTFVSNRSAIASALGDAELGRLPVIVLLTAATYVAGALSLSGAVTVDLPLGQTSEVMLAQSFLNRFTPANAGGMAFRARYLQRHGVDLVSAATSIGITSAASGVAQVLFLAVFLSWSGTSQEATFSLPDVDSIALVVVIVLVALAIVWVTPLRAKLVDSRLVVSARGALEEFRTLATEPGKLARLLGGAVLGKLVVLLAFVQAARAFGVDLGLAELGTLYLTANTVASAAPTPGGVGAIEAALVAALTGAGVDGASALSIVLVFRLVTFWLPVPPAWLALRHLRTTEAV